MECRGCGRENRADSRFCDACGSALAVRCSTCDRELNPDARFCDGCGTSVVAAGRATPSVAATSPDPEAVRKTVSVLFCDLVGSTAFAESVDTESAREAMSRYHSMAKAVIEANGGTVAKFIGDGVMALFGVPEVSEDDAERAVTAGAALQRGFVQVRDHIAERYGVDVGLRVGINTGEVVIDDADADLVGDVLNTAARLEAACTPGQVLVGEETWRLTRSAIGYEPLGEVTVKGKRDGLPTYQLVMADDGSGFAIGAMAQADSTPFIGRDDELGRLRALLADTLAVGEARLVTIIGSPGVGKTRLSRELGNAANGEADVVEIRCERAGTATFAPIVDLLQQVAGLDDGDTPEQIVAALRDLVGGEPDAARVVELLGGFVGTASPRSTEDAFFGVRRLVEVLGSHRPLVLVIDDIQWAEPLFLDLLEHLAEWSKAAPVLIVGLARPELREIRPALTETGRRVALVVSLEGLDAAATELLAAELLGGAELPRELTAKLPSSTDGNPLFVRELIRMLVDDGVIEQRDDRWELAVDLDAVEVPPTIQSLLATRVERLPPVERRVLEQASVIGPEFPLGALAELVPEIGRSELEAVIERLRRKEQVEPTGTYWGDEPIVRFHHVLIRDAAYRRLLKGARAELHLRVGDWMDRTASGLVGEFEVAIAYHFEQAQLYRRQLGDDDATTAEAGRRAAELLHVAADRALERDDLAAAAGLSRRAIDCHADDAESLSELLVLACESVLASGDATTGGALVKRLSEQAAGDARLEAWAACFTSQLAVMTDPTGLQQATEHTQEAASQFEALGDQAGLAKARIVRAGALARLGRVGECEAELDLALTAARSAGDRRRITAVLSSAPVAALWGPSPVARAGGRCLDVVRLSRITADSPAVVATSSRCQAVLEAMRGRFDTSRSLLDASRTTSLELGLDHGLLETSLYAGIVELLADDPIAAEPHLRHAFGGLGQLGIGADAGQAAAHLARTLLLQGRLDEADDLAADSDALAGQNLQTAIAARSAQAEILAARGDAASALALADEAVRMATDTDLVFDHANALSTLARVRAAAGDDDGAQRAASAARDLFAQKGATVSVEVGRTASTVTAPPAEAPSGPSGASALGDPADQPWNAADRLFRGWMQLFEEGDVAAWEARVHHEVRGSDRRSGVHFTFEGRAEFVRFMALIPETFGPVSVDKATIATRGDEFVLTEMHWTRVGDTAPMGKNLVITRMSEGLLLISITFDARDLRAAVVELDRLYLETLDPIEGAAFGVLARSFDHLMDRDLDKMLAGSDPNIAFPDHRQIGWEHRSGTAELGERFRTLTDLDGTLVSLIRNPLRQSPSLSCNRIRHYFEGPDGGQLVDDSVLMNRLDPATGLGVQIDQFADDQLDEALACFDAAQAEVDAAVPAPNTAVRVGGVANARARTASLDEFLAMFADDFTATLLNGTTVTLDDLRSGTVEPAALGYGVVDRRIMSVLTDSLAMLYVGFDDGTGHWSVEEVDDTHRLQRVRQFDDLVDAADAIDARWLAAAPETVPPTVVETMRAYRRGEIDALSDVLADDFTFVEHRALGFPSGDRQRFLDMCRELAELLHDAPTVVVCAHATDTRSAVLRTMSVSTTGDGAWESLVIVGVYIGDGESITRFEAFADDDLDAAIARYHELTGTTPPADAQLAPDDEPWNNADRWMRRAIALRSAGRLDEWAACFDEDVVWVSRRSLTGGSYRGRAEVSAAYTDQPVSMSAETLGVRGASLVLQRHQWVYRDQQVEFEFLLLTRWSADGLLTEAAGYDLADLRAAFEQLDEWNIEDLPPIDAAQLRANGAIFDALNDRDLDRAVRGFVPEVVYESHRQVSWGRLEHGEFVASMATITEYEGEALYAIERVERTGPNGPLSYQRLQFTDPHGSVLVSRFINVIRRLPANGLIALVESFPPDRAADARAVAERFAAETDADPMVNTAVIAGGLANALSRYGEPGDVLHLFADDFTATLTDGTTVTLDDLRTGTVEPIALGYGVVDRRTTSVLTDSLAMLYVGLDDGTGHWSVEEVDDSGRLCSVRQFASVAAAADAIEQRWSELGVDDVNTTVFDANRAMRQGDRTTMAALLADEFRVEDHRPLGFPTSDRDGFLSTFDLGTDVPDVMVVQCVYASSSRAQVWRVAAITDSSSGYVWESVVNLSVLGLRDGLLTSFDLFPEDDLDTAMARFHELDGTAPGLDDAPTAHNDEPWNDADRWMRRANEIRTHGHIAEFVEILAEDIVSEDRQTLAQHIYRGRDEVLTGFQSDVHPSIDADTIACRGQLLVLQQHVWRYPSADVEYECLYLARWNTAGQIVHAVFFDPTDLRAAFEQLDEWYIEELSPLDAARMRATSAYFDAANDRDLDRAVRTLAPDVVSTTHRAISWGELDRDGVAAGLATITGYDGEALFTNERVELSGPTGVVLASRLQFTDPHGNEMIDRFVTVKRVHPASGLIARMDHFQQHEARLARDLADRWTAETAADPRVNAAVIAGGLANALARYGDPGDLLCLLADDFVATLADGTTVTLEDLRDTNVEPGLLGFGVTDRETIAVRGERLALARIGNSQWSIEQLDDHDRLTRVSLFAHDDLLGAANALDDAAGQLAENAHIPKWAWELQHAHRNYDLDAIAAILDEDYVQIDHRPLGYAPMNKSEVIALFRTGLDDPTLRAVPVYSVMHRAFDGGYMASGGLWMRGTSDDYWNGNPFLAVASTVSSDLYPHDELGAAMARFDELDGSTATFGDTPRTEDDEPWNDADRRSRDLNAVWVGGDGERWANHLDDGIRWDDRRPMVGHHYVGRSDVVEGFAPPGAGMLTMRCEPIAVRGDRLVLYRQEINPSNDPTRMALAHLRIDQWNEDGQLAGVASFDPDDLAGAIRELNRRYADEVGFAPVKLYETQSIELYDTRTTDALMALFDPSTEGIDHRPLGWGTIDLDGLRDRIQSLVDMPGQLVAFESRLHRSEPHLEVVAAGYRVTDVSGSVVDEQHLLIHIVDPATGLAKRIETFAADSLDAALARADELTIEYTLVPTPNRAVVTSGSANRWARAGRADLFLDHFADGFTATSADGAIVTRDDLGTARVEPSALGYGVVDRKAIAVRGDRLALLLVEDCWSVEEVGPDGRLVRLDRFAYADLRSAVAHLEARTLTHDDAPRQADALVTMRRAVRELDADALDESLHPDFLVTDRRPLGFGPMGRADFVAFLRDDGADESYTSVPVISEIIASSEHGSVGRNAMWSGGASGEFWQTTPAINVIMVRDDLVVSMEMFADDDLDAAVARFHELDTEAGADDAWNRADRAGRELARLFSTGRIAQADLSEDVVMDDRRPLVRHSYVGRDELVAGFSTTGAIRPWAADVCDTLAVRADTLVLWTQRWSKVDDPGTVMESLVIHRINGDGLIDRMVVFDAEDLAAAVEELDRLYAESLDPTDLLEWRHLALLEIHYGSLNAGDLQTAMAIYDPSSVFIDHRPLGWGTLGLTGIRDRMQTLTESPDRYLFYWGRVDRSSSTSNCLTGRNHAVTAEGFVNDSDILVVSTMDPATGLVMRTEQFDPDHLDAALERFDEVVAAESAATIPPNRAVVSGGLANLRARHPEHDRFIDGLADDFTATLPDGSTVTLDDLRAGTITPTDLGFGVTERELVAVRGERLGFIRVEGGRWSIEETDEHDQLVRVTLYKQADLLAATNALELAARSMSDTDLVPEPIRQWLDAHRNNDVVGQTALTHDDFSMVDHRPLGYGTMDGDDAAALFAVRNEDETLRGVPVYGQIHAVSQRACVLAGAMWTQGAAGDYWVGLPFIGVYGSTDGRLRTIDMFAEGDVDGAMAHFDELTERPEPNSAERWQRELSAMINERRLDEFEARLAEGFIEDSRMTGFSFILDRDQFLAGLHIFAEQGQFMESLGVIATAGDLTGLHRREVTGDDWVSAFLQVGVFDADGNLTRLIEFDDDRLDDALAELARITGEPVALVDRHRPDGAHPTIS